MRKVFVDTDVILDFLLGRDLYLSEITEIMEKSITGIFDLSVSAVTISNLYYIIAKIQNKRSARAKIKKILKLVKVENVGETVIQKASESVFGDFEDAVQNFCAEEAKHKIIVTRNTRDFRASKLAIMTPKEFLSRV
ncbi:MAG: PIN domain-containing protein [Saprospiraceae bacterium]|nr:PIN domain-containing protein [Saprospiraceae bacterium]